jgi:hypothetical protein
MFPLDQHNLVSRSFISGHVVKAIVSKRPKRTEFELGNIQLDLVFFRALPPKNIPLKPQRENFTMHCLGLDQEFQLAKIPVQSLEGTPDGDNKVIG